MKQRRNPLQTQERKPLWGQAGENHSHSAGRLLPVGRAGAGVVFMGLKIWQGQSPANLVSLFFCMSGLAFLSMRESSCGRNAV